MQIRSVQFSAAYLALCLILALPLSPQAPKAVQPAKLEPMQNLEMDASRSGRTASIPKEWGRLVSVQRTSDRHYVLFLESGSGEIYLVRLVQRGEYLYLDTYDQGGVALVIQRTP